MIQSPFGKFTRQTKKATDFVRWHLFGSRAESVYFYTLHKCASSLFAGLVLPNALGLRHIHYARRIHRSSREFPLRFESRGHVYGPIRVSADRQSPVYEKFVQHVASPDFVKDKKAIFFVRDPRDILLSAYYSFGFHHKLSPDLNVRSRQLAVRSSLQSTDIDEYVLSNAVFFQRSFRMISELCDASQFGLVVKYEEMILDFDQFVASVNQFFDLTPAVIRHTHNVSRPKQNEVDAHRRSGQPGEFRRKLKPETVESLNLILADVLQEFGYE